MTINDEDLSRLQEELSGLAISRGEEASEVVVREELSGPAISRGEETSEVVEQEEEPEIESPPTTDLESPAVDDAEDSDASDSTVGSSSWTEGATTQVGSVSSFEDAESHSAGSEPEDEPFSRVCPKHPHPPYELPVRLPTKAPNDLRNDGRVRATCSACGKFLGFTDRRGVNEANPPCFCDRPRPSRMLLARVGKSPSLFKIFYRCANPARDCDYYCEPGAMTVDNRPIGLTFRFDDMDWLVDEGWV